MDDGLKDKHRQGIINILKGCRKLRKAVLFGSRATQTYTLTSDVDIALFGDNLTLADQATLSDKIEELNMAQEVDLLLYSTITNAKIKEHIKKDGVVWYERVVDSSDWQQMTLDEALEINPTVKMQKGDIYPFVDMSSIEGGNKYVAAFQKRKFKGSGSRFISDDTLMARITPCLENGKTSRYRSCDNIPAHGSTEFIVLRYRESVTHPEFIYYLTISDQVKPYAIAQMTGSSGRQRVPVDALRNLSISLPPLPEQKAIADALSSLDNKIELNRQMCKTLEKTAATLFKSWFIDFDPVKAKATLAGNGTFEGWNKTRAKAYLKKLNSEIADNFPHNFEDSELGSIPKGWTVHYLAEFANLVKGQSYKSVELSKSSTALVTLKSFHRGGGYRTDGLKDYTGSFKPEQVVSEGDLIVALTDVTQAADVIGKPATVRDSSSHDTLVASLDVGIIRFSNPEVISKEYCYFLMLDKRYTAHSLGYTSGTTVLHLAKNAVLDFKTWLPPNALMSGFSDIVATSQKRIFIAEKECESLSNTRDTLLPKLISGELRVKDMGSI